MRVGIPTETRDGEARVAATPETVRKLVRAGRHSVIVQAGAGRRAGIADDAFRDAGALLADSPREVYGQAETVLKVRAPGGDELPLLVRGQILIGLLSPDDEASIGALARTGVTAFALERVPRITRAQAMDVLSSQASIAGYKAMLIAANEYGRFIPMMMTAAGSVKPARVLILGAGVAGLQAIATARRLGAVVEAFDVRPAVKEEVESLGARFVEVPMSDTERAAAADAGGYAREASAEYRQRQAALVDDRARAADIVITTALVPGRPAPLLIREETVRQMRPGSVIVDLAVEQGGNCALSERDRVVVAGGVRIVGHSNLPALMAADASVLYANNVLNFLTLLVDDTTGEPRIDRQDEIVAASLVCTDGSPVLKPQTTLA